MNKNKEYKSDEDKESIENNPNIIKIEEGEPDPFENFEDTNYLSTL